MILQDQQFMEQISELQRKVPPVARLTLNHQCSLATYNLFFLAKVEPLKKTVAYKYPLLAYL